MLTISLDQLICHDEGDGSGNAEPYIWPVFFKVDGETFSVVSADVGLIGSPTVVSTSGHHGNLGPGTNDVDADNVVQIPPGVGSYRTDFVPIPVLDPGLRTLIGDTIPGVAGVVVVVREEDSFPPHAARTGYDALVDAVHLAVTKIAASYQHALAAPTAEQIQERISAMTSTVGKRVKGAVMEDLDAWELVWFATFGNQDDKIGTGSWVVLSDARQPEGRIAFSQRWSINDEEEPADDGDWELQGKFVWFTRLSLRSALLSRGHPADSSLHAVMAPEISVQRWLSVEP